MNLLKDKVIEKYGTINAFLDKYQKRLGISRTHAYKLINYKINPGVETLARVAILVGLPITLASKDYVETRKILEKERKDEQRR